MKDLGVPTDATVEDTQPKNTNKKVRLRCLDTFRGFVFAFLCICDTWYSEIIKKLIQYQLLFTHIFFLLRNFLHILILE